jgi:hypothetical protein
MKQVIQNYKTGRLKIEEVPAFSGKLSRIIFNSDSPLA